MKMQNKLKSGPDDGPKQCLNTSQTTISYANRFFPSLISITPEAQLRLSVLKAVVSKHIALTRLSTPHFWRAVTTELLIASPEYHSLAFVRREAAPLVNHNNYKRTLISVDVQHWHWVPLATFYRLKVGARKDQKRFLQIGPSVYETSVLLF